MLFDKSYPSVVHYSVLYGDFTFNSVRTYFRGQLRQDKVLLHREIGVTRSRVCGNVDVRLVEVEVLVFIFHALQNSIHCLWVQEVKLAKI